jgi:hypothetical protein
MIPSPRLSRRSFLLRAGATGVGLALAARENLLAGEPPATDSLPTSNESLQAATRLISKIADPEIRAGMESAVIKDLLPAAKEIYYPGHFTVTVHGEAYGKDTTFPGLDSWQMAGAYLLLGQTRVAKDYFEFVRASQRKDGNIAIAIFPGNAKPEGTLINLKTPEDIFNYKPPKREGLPASSQETRAWIGQFKHWHPKYPFGTLAPVSYILTAAEIFDADNSTTWLRERLPSVEATGKFLLTLKDKNGLIGGAGFYSELPARYKWDGLAQCYTIHAFREVARLFGKVGDTVNQSIWSGHADKLAETFHAAFWRKDHFGEYIHPERGLIDTHGLSDVNWAAVAFGIAVDRKLNLLWPRLIEDKGFWWGDMPTQSVSKPLTYEKWEYEEPIAAPLLHDVASMGRVWYLEALACQRMGARERLAESVRKVSRAASPEGHWRERYHPQPNGTVTPASAEKYCEYPAILIRVVLGNKTVFFRD